jgi:Flp pilus assembly protein TadD
MDEGDYRSGIAQLKEVVRLEPENFEAQLDLGICYAQKGFYAEAERAYEKARSLNAEDLLLNYNLAALYALWSRPKDSVGYLKKAIAADRPKVQSWLSTDPMFDSLKSDPEFERLF